MMTKEEALISRFYQSFQKLDAAGMNACYADNIVFHDPVFGMLEGDQVRCMWEMLCRNARDFSLEFATPVDLGEGYYTCDWIARYTFSKTGRKIENRIKANMRIVDGKIAEHSDAFGLHRWSKQAFGFTGWLLGGFGFFQRKIRNSAHKNLLAYIRSH